MSSRWSTKKIAPEVAEKLWSLVQTGQSLASIAKVRGTTPEAIGYLLRSRGYIYKFKKVCDLPECRKEFETDKAKQRACCRSHLKLLNSRKKRGVTTLLLPCALPECDKLVWMTHKAGSKPGLWRGQGGSGKRFCCKAHGELMCRRKKSKLHKRILENTHQCAAPGCLENLILDEHHEEFHKHKSNKSSKTYWLCPTHHMMIHRGFAELQNGSFISKVPSIIEGIKRKADIFDGYMENL